MCKSTFLIRNKKSGIKGQREFLAVPCGKCPQCISSRVNSWVFRVERELLVSSSALFVTLTYREDSVPLGIDYNLKDKTAFISRILEPRHLTLYFKSLRKAYDSQPIRYFACGEYGSVRKRPHYHVVLLNCDDLSIIQDKWPHGHVDISPVKSISSIRYMLKYLSKCDSYCPAGVAPFHRMSKGLGRNYLNAETISFHKRRLDNVVVSLNNGIKISLPKYFKDKIYDPYERYKLTNYLQERADILLDKRVDSIIRATLQSEESVLHSLYVEPFVDANRAVLEKPTIF